MRGKLKSFAERQKIREAAASGASQRAIARMLGIHRKTVKKYAGKS